MSVFVLQLGALVDNGRRAVDLFCMPTIDSEAVRQLASLSEQQRWLFMTPYVTCYLDSRRTVLPMSSNVVEKWTDQVRAEQAKQRFNCFPKRSNLAQN